MISNRSGLSLLILAFLLSISACREISHPPGILAEEPPIQNNLDEHESVRMEEFILTKKAEFHVKARVLSKKRYKRGRDSKISKYDLALGWGPMSDSRVLDHISISQRLRFFFWKSRSLPISANNINLHSSNMHIVTIDPDMNRKLKRVRTGHIVEFSGHLVDIRADGGWRWRTSMNRNDTGNGACEIVYLDSFRILD